MKEVVRAEMGVGEIGEMRGDCEKGKGIPDERGGEGGLGETEGMGAHLTGEMEDGARDGSAVGLEKSEGIEERCT